MSCYDYIIVGSGIAGLYTSLLAEKYGRVLVVTKGSIDDCNTKYAQGGIAAAIGKNDSPELHYRDTVAAGDGLSDEEAARILANEASDRISDLVNLGVPFDTLDGKVALALEAAHSVPRVIHAGGDATGEYIEVTLSNRVRSSKVRLLENCLATKILVDRGAVTGIKALDCVKKKTMEFECRNLILATGGAGQLFQFTTNSEVATGDGIALAFNAGAEIMDMEFFQFHPTAIRLPGITSFLISEAVRGEGGILRNIDGHRFMPDYTPEAELAPRDVVARSLVYEMQKTGSDTVFVDVTHLSPRIITSRFPHIYRFCLDHGLDITKDMLPVAPAAHYMMGGVKVNIWGETKIAGLFAAGEIACTGVHGANRLASNSMLEVVVFSKRIIERSKDRVENSITSTDKKVHHKLSERQPSGTIPSLTLPALQKLHWDKVGVIRNKEGLIKAADVLATWQKTAPRPTERRSYEFNNLILAGRLVTESALLREESRGAHFRSGFTDSNPQWRRHLVFTR